MEKNVLANDSGPAVDRPDPKTVKAVRDFVNLFVKTIHTILLYPPTNPLPDQFRSNFYRAAQKILQEDGALLLATTEQAFYYEGEIVYEEEPSDTNPATALFRDGVREIGLLPSLTDEEADAFLNVFVKALSRTGEPPEIANMFWELGCSSIYYRTIDHVIDQVPAAPLESADYLQTSRLFFSTVALDEIQRPDPEEDVEQDPHGYQGIQKDRYLQVRDIFQGEIELGDAQARQLRDMLERDAAGDCLAEAFVIYDEILHNDHTSQMSAEIIRAARRQFDVLAEEDNWTLLPNVLSNIKTWQAKFAKKPHIAGPLRDILYHAGNKETLSRLAAYLNSHPQADLAPFTAYLERLEAVSLGAVTALLGDLEHHAARKMVYTYLGERADQAIDLVGNFVYDERWFVVRNVALILGKANRPRAVNFLKKAIRHDDPRVRREAVRSLGALSCEETDTLLLSLLDDQDQSLRLHACKALAGKHSTAVFEALEKRIGEPELAGLESRLQRELLAAFARAGGDRALPRLSSLIKKRKLFGKSRLHQIRINAVYALCEIDSPSARRLLQELSQVTDEPTRAAARQILERPEHREATENDDPREDVR